jgi:hypothetical protein
MTRPLYRSCPTPVIRSNHPLDQNASQRGEICTSIIMQSKNLDIIESRMKRIPQRVSKHQQEVDSKVFKPKPSYGKRAYEEAQAWNQSTTPKANTRQLSICVPDFTLPVPPAASVRSGSMQGSEQMSEQVVKHNAQQPNLIGNDEDESIANVFCFGVFADKNSSIIYHDLTGSFPFMSLDGSVCFFVLYHYKSNCILGTPIAGLDDKSIFEAYKTRFKELKLKGFKPKLNAMDNQATKYIKKFLTKNECKLQLVEPRNHQVNAAERAIQTFKDTFIAALAMTDSNFPLQLWDKITPQVQDMLNMMHASGVDPTISAYKALNGPYNWNRYPLAPLGCKAVVYEDGDSCRSWVSRGVDGWYLGPSKDHYRCNYYFIPETRALS